MTTTQKTTIIGAATLLVVAGITYLNGQATDTILSLVANNNKIAKGQNFLVKVDLTTNKNANGADVFVTFDPTFLELQDQFIKGNFQYPLIATTTNSVSFSALGDNINGTLRTLYFKSLKTGTTTIHIVASPNTTTDSNVADQNGNDVLDATKDLDLTIVAPSGK